jgi:aspartyl-tRNA(Asn)/glutamyl-tRNA(Gln) amidotransferase subunit B
MKYIATIGLEVHVQLKTRSKMFCASPVEFGAEPNTHTCPICLGLPGALPVMNHEALHLTVLTGLMLGCDIAPICKFDRKNYFYPDMPKNYQISQYDMPLCTNGAVPLHDLAYPKDAQKNIVTPGREVHLVRIHLEEDVAKSFHFENSTGIDFNRAGTPLMEIVTQPEAVTGIFRANLQGRQFRDLRYRAIRRTRGIDGDLSGSFRCDTVRSFSPRYSGSAGSLNGSVV